MIVLLVSPLKNKLVARLCGCLHWSLWQVLWLAVDLADLIVALNIGKECVHALMEQSNW